MIRSSKRIAARRENEIDALLLSSSSDEAASSISSSSSEDANADVGFDDSAPLKIQLSCYGQIDKDPKLDRNGPVIIVEEATLAGIESAAKSYLCKTDNEVDLLGRGRAKGAYVHASALIFDKFQLIENTRVSRKHFINATDVVFKARLDDAKRERNVTGASFALLQVGARYTEASYQNAVETNKAAMKANAIAVRARQSLSSSSTGVGGDHESANDDHDDPYDVTIDLKVVFMAVPVFLNSENGLFESLHGNIVRVGDQNESFVVNGHHVLRRGELRAENVRAVFRSIRRGALENEDLLRTLRARGMRVQQGAAILGRGTRANCKTFSLLDSSQAFANFLGNPLKKSKAWQRCTNSGRVLSAERNVYIGYAHCAKNDALKVFKRSTPQFRGKGLPAVKTPQKKRLAHNELELRNATRRRELTRALEAAWLNPESQWFKAFNRGHIDYIKTRFTSSSIFAANFAVEGGVESEAFKKYIDESIDWNDTLIAKYVGSSGPPKKLLFESSTSIPSPEQQRQAQRNSGSLSESLNAFASAILSSRQSHPETASAPDSVANVKRGIIMRLRAWFMRVRRILFSPGGSAIAMSDCSFSARIGHIPAHLFEHIQTKYKNIANVFKELAEPKELKDEFSVKWADFMMAAGLEEFTDALRKLQTYDGVGMHPALEIIEEYLQNDGFH